MIESANEFGRLSLLELNEFEQVNGKKLPQDYRDFLLEFNGGMPNPNSNVKLDRVVLYILGMHNGDYYASLYKHIDMFAGRLPFSTFPIATDPFGNLYLMSLHSENYGQIFFWDHEGEPENQDGHYVDNCSFVAYSFTQFLNELTLNI